MSALRERCAKRVHSGERWDISGHRCGNYAKEGSDFCGRHTPDNTDHTRDALESPRVATEQRTTYTATLKWEPGQGPVVRTPYRYGFGFITYVRARAVDDSQPYVEVRGVMRKKDGTPGEQTWDATMRADKLLGPDNLAALLAALDAERNR